MPRRQRHLSHFTVTLVVGILGGSVGAAGVELKLTATEVYVGVPFQLRIAITDAGEYRQPRRWYLQRRHRVHHAKHVFRKYGHQR